MRDTDHKSEAHDTNNRVYNNGNRLERMRNKVVKPSGQNLDIVVTDNRGRKKRGLADRNKFQCEKLNLNFIIH